MLDSQTTDCISNVDLKTLQFNNIWNSPWQNSFRQYIQREIYSSFSKGRLVGLVFAFTANHKPNY